MKNTFWKNKRVLVTGAGGFIGSHLVEELVKSGAAVTALIKYNSHNYWGNFELLPDEIKNEVNVFTGDICDENLVRNAVKSKEVVFHLAALISIPYSYSAPKSFFEVNVGGTLNILQAALDYGVSKIIHTSTSEVYGTAIYIPIDENHPLQAQSPYSASKISADKLAESFYLSYSLPVATVRPFNTFGERQSGRAIIPTIISQILSGSPAVKLGLLKPVRDFLYVKDTVNGFLKTAESRKTAGQVLNIGTSRGIKMEDLVKKIMKLTGIEKRIVTESPRIRPPESEVMKLICSYKKAKRLCGWQPEIPFEEGLIKVISFIKENLNLYKTDIYNI
ncbi:MAG: SDR family NAD(P)-dependent oxidoreductase [Elusimicrobiota bacterium]